MREYLDGLEEDDPVPVAKPKKISPSDPQARWTAAPGGPAFYAYSTNYLVDTDAGIIVDVEATPAHRSLEVQSTKTIASGRLVPFGLRWSAIQGLRRQSFTVTATVRHSRS